MQNDCAKGGCYSCDCRYDCDAYTDEDATSPMSWILPNSVDDATTLKTLTVIHDSCVKQTSCLRSSRCKYVDENARCLYRDKANEPEPCNWVLPTCDADSSSPISRKDVPCLSKKYTMKAKVIIKLPKLIETDYPSDLNGLAFEYLCENLANLSSAEIANKIREYTRFKFKPVKDKGYKETAQYKVPEPKPCPVCDIKPLITFAPDSSCFTVRCRNSKCPSVYACTNASAKVAVDGWNEWCEYKK